MEADFTEMGDQQPGNTLQADAVSTPIDPQVNDRLLTKLTKAIRDNIISQYLDSKSTGACMVSCRLVHSHFTQGVMPKWRRKLQQEFQIPGHITDTCSIIQEIFLHQCISRLKLAYKDLLGLWGKRIKQEACM